MRRYGDICKISGYEVPAVDVITGGSPCQDLSVAGKRAGLRHSELGDEETTRSGLFMEQMRLDYLFVIPAGIPPHKQIDASDDPIHRLRMCELAFGGGARYASEIRRFYRACRGEELLEIGGKAALATHRLAFSLYEAACKQGIYHVAGEAAAAPSEDGTGIKIRYY